MADIRERYLTAVGRRLWTLSSMTRTSIIAELRDHLTAEAMALGGVSDTNLATAVARATPPGELTAAYREIHPMAWPLRAAVASTVLFCAILSSLPRDNPDDALWTVGLFTLLYLITLVWLSLRSGPKLAVGIALASALLRLLITADNMDIYGDVKPDLFWLGHLLVSTGAVVLAWFPGYWKGRASTDW